MFWSIEVTDTIICRWLSSPTTIVMDSRIRMTPFETLCGRRCRTPLCWYDSGESVELGPEIV